MVHNGHDQPMEIDCTSDSNRSNAESGVPMKCSSPQMYGSNSMEFGSNDMSPIGMAKEVFEPPAVQQIPDEVEMAYTEPVMYTIPVKFFQGKSESVFWAKDYAKNKTFDQVVKEFASANGLNINDLVLTDHKDGLLEPKHQSLELYLECDQTEMDIYFEVEAKKRTTIKRTTSILRPTKNNQRPKLQVYLTFKDQTAKRDQMEINFNESDTFSVAIERIVDVMDLDRSKTHFFNSTGTIHSSYLLSTY